MAQFEGKLGVRKRGAGQLKERGPVAGWQGLVRMGDVDAVPVPLRGQMTAGVAAVAFGVPRRGVANQRAQTLSVGSVCRRCGPRCDAHAWHGTHTHDGRRRPNCAARRVGRQAAGE